jgi:hypothetical protein
MPLAIAITGMPGWSQGAIRSPAQATPRELTPLTMISAPSNAVSMCSTW